MDFQQLAFHSNRMHKKTSWIEEELSGSHFNDERLNKRCKHVMDFVE